MINLENFTQHLKTSGHSSDTAHKQNLQSTEEVILVGQFAVIFVNDHCVKGESCQYVLDAMNIVNGGTDNYTLLNHIIYSALEKVLKQSADFESIKDKLKCELHNKEYEIFNDQSLKRVL
ncbi:hypothetical protein EMPG_13053 [Blastomyces silverae]|uniref:Uncharacterized protein n=1 Tax=Blastomyces silverae TaxID=2060906 RepID=A0A0H1BJX2_9EURO|nr:hypothetical protein EMPG_13053 [Blastomyces silverae]